MNATKRTNSEAVDAEVTEKTEAVESAVTLYIKGVERVVNRMVASILLIA